MGEVKDNDLIKLTDNITEASVQLQLASLSLRSCYVTNDSSVTEFVQLRNSVNNEAKVYSIKILPFANAVISYIQKFCENYTFLTFGQFVDNIAELADEANLRVQLCKFTAELHKSILVGFKRKQDKAIKVRETLKLKAEELAKREQELKSVARTKYDWALGLAFIPIVGIIASPILSELGDSAIREAAATAHESDIAVAASNVIKGALIESISNFVNAITKIAGFFEVLTNELNMLAEDHHQEDPRKLHYLRILAKAKVIIDACRLYISRIPDCETNLRAIPDNYDKNYVQEWLSKENVDVNGKPTSFVTWGQNIFRKNKQLIEILSN